MPRRNIIKTYAPDSYYHIYSRGVNKSSIFTDDEDKKFFLSLFQRYLSHQPPKRPKHRAYESFADRIDLLAYCLMDNHIHILIYQRDDSAAMPALMRSIMASYSMYYNTKHRRLGPLFESSYLASRIDSDSYLDHISRYIHLNPRNWRSFQYSSLRYYLGEAHADWIKPDYIVNMFRERNQDYLSFLQDGIEESEAIDDLAHE